MWNEGQLKVAVMGEMVGAKVRLEVRVEERVGEVRVRGRGGYGAGGTCIRRNSAGSSGAKPAGSKPIWPGLYPGRSK